MPRRGETIENPVTGERITFLETAAETGGALARAELTIAPGGFAAAEHVHPHADERFEVRDGALHTRIAGLERPLAKGESLVVPKGTPHVWWNRASGPTRVLVEFRPATRMAEFLDAFFALARAGKTGRDGMPNLLRMAPLAREFSDSIRLAWPPFAVQRLFFAVVAPLGRLIYG